MIDRKELQELVNKLDNGIDKFIVAGLFYGLNGGSTNKEQLLNITTDSVDFEKSTITLPDGRVVVMDNFLKKITKEAIEQKIYIKMGSQGKTNEDYYLNPSNKFIIKTKPTSKNNNGIDSLTFAGLRTRLSSISKFLLGNNELNANNLKQSGAFAVLSESEEPLTIAKADALLKSKGLSIGRNIMVSMLKMIDESR